MMTPGYYSGGLKRAGDRQGFRDSGAAHTPGCSSCVSEAGGGPLKCSIGFPVPSSSSTRRKLLLNRRSAPKGFISVASKGTRVRFRSRHGRLAMTG